MMRSPLLQKDASQTFGQQSFLVLFIFSIFILGLFLNRIPLNDQSEYDVGVRLSQIQTEDLTKAFMSGDMLDNVPAGTDVICIEYMGDDPSSAGIAPYINGHCVECEAALKFVTAQNKENKEAAKPDKKAKCWTNEYPFIASGIVRSAARKVLGECVKHASTDYAMCSITDPALIKMPWPDYQGMKPNDPPPFNGVCNGNGAEISAEQAYNTHVKPGAEMCAAAKMLDAEGNALESKKNWEKITAKFIEFGNHCSNQLDSGSPEDQSKKAAFWSGDIAISLFVRTEGYTTLEGTTLGAAMDYKVMFDTLRHRGDGCIARFWTCISKSFTESMRQETVNVFLGAVRFRSAYFKTELERSLSNTHIKSTTFRFINNECKCPRPRNDATCLKELNKMYSGKGCEIYGTAITCPHVQEGALKDRQNNLLGCLRKGLCDQQELLRSKGFPVMWAPPGIKDDWPSLQYHDPGNEAGAVKYIPYTESQNVAAGNNIPYDQVETYIWEGFCSQWDLGEANVWGAPESASVPLPLAPAVEKASSAKQEVKPGKRSALSHS